MNHAQRLHPGRATGRSLAGPDSRGHLGPLRGPRGSIDEPIGRGALHFWFDFGSNYSYIALMRIDAMAAARGIALFWRPMLLGPIFRELGWRESPFVDQPEKAAYIWQDMRRECRKHGLAWTQPTRFPRRSVLPARVALLGAGEPWIAPFCRAVMQLNFVSDRDIDDTATVREVLVQLALPADAILDAAQAEPNKLALRAQTEAARARGIFGAPTFLVGDEMFWGNDRLEDALDFAAGNIKR